MQCFFLLASDLIKKLSEIHQAGVLLGDVSPNNLMVDPKTSTVRFFDFETAVEPEGTRDQTSWSAMWGTQGFKRPTRAKAIELRSVDDWYSVGMLLYSFVLPVQSLFAIEPTSRELFIDQIAMVVGLPASVKNTIVLLWDGCPEAALQGIAFYLNSRNHAPQSVSPASSLVGGSEPLTSRGAILASIEDTLEGVASYLNTTLDVSRKDRLWPSDYRVYQTNPFGLAYGACGPLIALKDLRSEVSVTALQWLDKGINAWDQLPSGLHSGLSGIAWTYAELGLTERAVELIKRANNANRPDEVVNLADGLAGRGHANLFLYKTTSQSSLLGCALSIAEAIVRRAEITDNGVCWRDAATKEVRHGLGYGGSGIALFLLAAYQYSRTPELLTYARGAMDSEIVAAMGGGGALTWSRQGQSKTKDPYMITGGSGISSALLALWRVTGEERYLEQAKSAADGAYSRFAVMPGLFEGVSGIGETALDLYEATGQDEYLSRAFSIVESVLCYRIRRSQGITFPGRALLRISQDFAYGTAGIACFLTRMLTLRPRHIYDLRAVINK